VSPILGIIASSQQGAFILNPAYESIATVTLGTSASTISFTSIPSTYTHLQLRGSIQSNRSSYNVDNATVRFNSDSGANYSRHNVNASASTTTAPEAYGTGGATFGGPIPVVTGVATNVFNGFVLDILDYANTNKYKTMRILAGYDVNGTGGTGSFGGTVGLYSGAWQNTNAVTSITFAPVDGTNFTQYSTVALYGIKG
jgi:hypothetical protein